MALLLAKPNNVIPLWEPLAHAINRWLWRWSPWHLWASRENLRTQNLGAERLSYSYRFERHWVEQMRGSEERADYIEYVDQVAAKNLGLALLKAGRIAVSEETCWHTGDLIRRYDLRAKRPC